MLSPRPFCTLACQPIAVRSLILLLGKAPNNALLPSRRRNRPVRRPVPLVGNGACAGPTPCVPPCQASPCQARRGRPVENEIPIHPSEPSAPAKPQAMTHTRCPGRTGPRHTHCTVKRPYSGLAQTQETPRLAVENEIPTGASVANVAATKDRSGAGRGSGEAGQDRVRVVVHPAMSGTRARARSWGRRDGPWQPTRTGAGPAQ